jgi:peptide-methionine (R)-S-oxide reductase
MTVTTRRTFLTILAASPVLLWLGYKLPVVKALSSEQTPGTTVPKPTKIRVYSVEKKGIITVDKVVKTDAEWEKILTPEQFSVLRKKGTERAFTGQYWHNEEKGLYKCAACNNDLFLSQTKFDSGTGWPSFYQPIAPENVEREADNSFDMERTEVQCARCDGHLGHVFDDGPKPTGLRYCMNSVSLKFIKTA